MATNINTIISWFKDGLNPNENQFKAAWLSFWHKDANIPVNKILGLSDILDQKADADKLESHIANVRAQVIVFGNPFLLIKHPINNDKDKQAEIQAGDTICDGYLDNNTLWLKATCVNITDINNPDNWLLHDSLDITINFTE